MNSVSSPGTTWPKRFLVQSSLACSMRSLLLETKFHQMKRGPSRGSPPTSAMRAAVCARIVTATPGANTIRRPGSYACPSMSTVPSTR
ncbi:Uncharacterised protein [Bordetella pertussis]|nr:Uncharacterised protein [Bordetella pertussis]